MGADSVSVFYGIRFQVDDPTELKDLTLGRHPLVKRAKKVGLEHIWGDYSADNSGLIILYIGKCLGTFGQEGQTEMEISDLEFARIQRETRKRIESAGFSLVPALMFQLEIDY